MLLAPPFYHNSWQLSAYLLQYFSKLVALKAFIKARELRLLVGMWSFQILINKRQDVKFVVSRIIISSRIVEEGNQARCLNMALLIVRGDLSRS